MIFAIDPGTQYSAFVRMGIDKHGYKILAHGHLPNDEMLIRMRHLVTTDRVAIEFVQSFGMPVGREVFETCKWVGQFMEAVSFSRTDCPAHVENEPTLIYRKEVKMTLCNSLRAKDKNIRQAIIDIFPRSGGGKTPQIGTKHNQGPLFGVTSHVWSALAVAITFDKQGNCG